MKRQFLFGTMLTTVLAIGASAQTPQTPPAGQGSTATPSDTRSQPGQNQSGQSLTLTGCLQPASQTPGGASTGAGAAGAGAGASTGAGSTASASGQRGGNYILTNVSPSSAAGSAGATGAAGTAGTGAATGAASTGSTAASGAPATSYRLMGGDSQNLSQYVGQRVEVTGTVSGAGATGAGGAGTGATGGAATGGAATGGAATGGAATGGAATGAGASTGAGSRSGGDMPMLRVTAVKPASGGGSCSQ